MGDRGNIAIAQPESEAVVYFYTHWGGYEIPQTLQRALARHERWNDGPYLARIIFCEMVKNDIDGETGFGISTTEQDNSYDIPIVDAMTQTVTVLPYGRSKPPVTVTFDDWVNGNFGGWGNSGEQE